jgi:hypothetical protein
MAMHSLPFRVEREMLPALGPALQLLSRKKSRLTTYIVEPYMGRVIPDALIGHWRTYPALNAKSITYVDACVIAIAERVNCVSMDELQSLLYLDRSKLQSITQKLIRAGLLKGSGTGQFRIAKSLSNSVRIVAVEMKLKKWRDALAQACTYRSFADASCVILDGNQVRRSKEMLRHFRAEGVGLYLQYGERLVAVSRAVPSRIVSPDRVLAAYKLFVAKPSQQTTCSHTSAIQ